MLSKIFSLYLKPVKAVGLFLMGAVSLGRRCDLDEKGHDVPVFDNKVGQVKLLCVCLSQNTLLLLWTSLNVLNFFLK